MPRSQDPSLPELPALQPTWLAVVRAYHLCDQVLTRRLADLGLKTSEHEVLVNLLLYPGSTQQQLGAHLFAAKSVVSSLVTKLEARGLLERAADANDARIWRLHLTRTGHQLARRALAVQIEVVTAMGEGSNATDNARLVATLDRVSAILQAMP
ncbi:MarR family winged helix-turn-helix transcriptional regulator [Inhella sp.]|uniref:MarR family winged helix-turn-helix transcriptional regulator n=1 Tax=Inhella sp. TaxID=1921806 RepID=UPI0035AE9559